MRLLSVQDIIEIRNRIRKKTNIKYDNNFKLIAQDALKCVLQSNINFAEPIDISCILAVALLKNKELKTWKITTAYSVLIASLIENNYSIKHISIFDINEKLKIISQNNYDHKKLILFIEKFVYDENGKVLKEKAL